MRRILALDLGTRFGYAVYELEGQEGRLVKSGAGDLTVARSTTNPGARYAAFHQALRGLAGATPPNEIAYEHAWHQLGKAAGVWHGLHTITMIHALQANATLHPYAVATIKKHASGSGRAKKFDMISAARSRWGVEPSCDNHADALCVLSLHLTRRRT